MDNLAAKRLEGCWKEEGESSTTSKPTISFPSIASFKKEINSWKESPHGSGFPTSGIIEGLRTSKSIEI